MNQKLTSQMCALIGCLYFLGNGPLVFAQVTSESSINQKGVNIYDTNTTAYVINRIEGVTGSGNGMGGYSGYGMQIPPAYAYGEYACCGRGLKNCYHRKFGSDFCFDWCCYGTGGNNYVGLDGCCHQYRCRYPLGHSCHGPLVSNMCGPACCSPLPNCCGAMTVGAVMNHATTKVAPATVTTTPTPLDNNTSAPPADTANPAPAVDSAKPGI